MRCSMQCPSSRLLACASCDRGSREGTSAGAATLKPTVPTAPMKPRRPRPQIDSCSASTIARQGLHGGQRSDLAGPGAERQHRHDGHGRQAQLLGGLRRKVGPGEAGKGGRQGHGAGGMSGPSCALAGCGTRHNRTSHRHAGMALVCVNGRRRRVWQECPGPTCRRAARARAERPAPRRGRPRPARGWRLAVPSRSALPAPGARCLQRAR
jgi:hypothetical protein